MTARNVLLAGQSVLIENLVFAAADQTGMSLDAGNEAVAIAGDGEARERPEGGLATLGGHGGGALETDDG